MRRKRPLKVTTLELGYRLFFRLLPIRPAKNDQRRHRDQIIFQITVAANSLKVVSIEECFVAEDRLLEWFRPHGDYSSPAKALRKTASDIDLIASSPRSNNNACETLCASSILVIILSCTSIGGSGNGIFAISFAFMLTIPMARRAVA